MTSENTVPEADPRHRPGGSLAVSRPALWSEDELRDINTIDELKARIAERGDVTTADAASFGNGYSVLEDKAVLMGRELYIIDWRFNVGDNGEFVTLQVLSEDRNGGTEKWIVNDGSTGIREQLRKIEAANGGKTAVIRVKKGFRVSEYDYTDAVDGKTKRAKTYYISTER